MKALTLWQPWASAIACGAKRIETRSWSTRHRGPLAIHAAACRIHADHLPLVDLLKGRGGMFGEKLPLGCIVATCTLLDVVSVEQVRDGLFDEERRFGDYSDGRYAWLLAEVKPINPPVPATGARGLWDWVQP